MKSNYWSLQSLDIENEDVIDHRQLKTNLSHLTKHSREKEPCRGEKANTIMKPSRIKMLYVSLALACAYATPAFADGGDISKVQTFIQSVIQVLVTFSGLIAAGFFVIGGIGYITSSGNPEHLDRSKRTIIYSAIGLAIAIGAFVLTNIVTQLAGSAFN